MDMHSTNTVATTLWPLPGVGQQLVEEVATARMVPEMVVRVADGPLGLEDLFQHFPAGLYPLARLESRLMLNVLVTMPFSEAQLDRMRARLAVAHGDARGSGQRADYARADVLYAGTPPRDLAGPGVSSGCSCTWPA